MRAAAAALLGLGSGAYLQTAKYQEKKYKKNSIAPQHHKKIYQLDKRTYIRPQKVCVMCTPGWDIGLLLWRN